MSAVRLEADSVVECIIACRYGFRPFTDVVPPITIRYCTRLISAAVSHINHLFSLYYCSYYYILNSLISQYNLVSLLFRLLAFLIRFLKCENAEQRQNGNE